MIDLGARDLVISLGDKGILAVTADGCWRAQLPGPLSGNATGAGDACVAALARGLVEATPWPQRLRAAVALSAAAVADPTAGGFDSAVLHRLQPRVTIEEI